MSTSNAQVEGEAVADRETLLAETFVALADTMISDFDVVDFLSMLSARCVDLFDAGDAGLMLADGSGNLVVVASSSHRMRELELFELQHDEGPCPEAFHLGQPVECGDLREATERWPRFVAEALEAGYRSVHALPMRLRDDVIGALNLIRVSPGSLPEDDLDAAQALANVATIGILHHRAAEESRLLSEQLQHALTSRIVIEQAKGILAERHGTTPDEAFELMRRDARSRRVKLHELALGITATAGRVDGHADKVLGLQK
jgi:GAF domain-containing protein